MLRKIKISLLTTIMLLSVFSFVSADDSMDISYITGIVSGASNYDSNVFNHISAAYSEFSCFETQDYFVAFFYPFDNCYITYGDFNYSFTYLEYRLTPNWPQYIYRVNASFDSSMFKTAYNSSKLAIGCSLYYNKNTNIVFVSEQSANPGSLLSNKSENLTTRDLGSENNSTWGSSYSPFYRYQKNDTMSNFDTVILLNDFGTNTVYQDIYFSNVINRVSTSSNLGLVDPTSAVKFAFDNRPPSSVSDDRLDIYSLKSSNGSNNLIVDLSAFRGNYSPAAAKTFSDVTLTLDLDGTEQEFVIPAASSTVTDSWSYDLNLYSISTPYAFFGLDNYDNVTIVKAAFSMTTSSPGGSSAENFNILCNYSMKYTPDPLAPEDIPVPDYKDTEVKTDSELEDMKSELHEQSSRFSFINGTWNFIPEADLPTFPGWANVYTNYVWFADGNSDTTYRGKWYQMANNIPSIADLSRPFDPAAWVENNLTWAYYDVVLLKVYTVNVGFNDPLAVIGNYSLSGYLVFISDRYYDHYQIENQLDLFKLIKYTGDNDVLFFDYMRNKLDDFESKSLTGISSIIDINNNGVSWLQTINNKCVTLDNSLTSGFASVVSAIENIPQPVPFDDTNILSAVNNGFSNLQSRMTYLFVPSFSWQAVNYTEYLDSLGILSVPFRFGSQALNGLENNYSPNFEFTIAAFNMPLPQGGSFQLWDQQEVDFNIVEAGLPGSLWSNLQNFFFWICIIGQSYYTYCHIFRERGGEDIDI